MDYKTTIFLTEADKQRIQIIKEKYGVTSLIGVIRLALTLASKEKGDG